MENVESAEGHRHGPEPHVGLVAVRVYTTSGSFPGQADKRVKVTEIVGEILGQAAKALQLTGTNGWVATVDGRDIDPNKTYLENHLTGTVTIHWGPREGGGG